MKSQSRIPLSGRVLRGALVLGLVGGVVVAGPSCSPSSGSSPTRQTALVNVRVSGLGGGMIVSDPVGLRCADACSAEFAAETLVKLTAVPDDGVKFLGWRVGSPGNEACADTSPTCQVQATGTPLVTAVFEAVRPVVSGISPLYVSRAGGSLITIRGTDFLPGLTVTIGGVPAQAVTVLSPTSLQVTVPAGTKAGYAAVQITNPGGPPTTVDKGIVFAPTSVAFGTAQTTGVAQAPKAVQVADFDRDGKPDVLVGSNNGGKIQFLKGNGDGTLMAPVDVVSLANIYGVQTADLDGNGKMDAVAISASGSKMIVISGNGDGTFSQVNEYATGQAPYGLVLGDFNGDGKPDAATANNQDGSVSVFIGNGDNSFKDAVNYPAGAKLFGIAVADINGDNFADIATISTDKIVYLLTGKGDGTFNAATSISPIGNYPTSLALGDVTGDGKPDLAVTNLFGTGLTLRQGDSLGGFATGFGSFDIGAAFTAFPEFAVLWDINLDGRLDVVGGNNVANGQVSYWLNEGSSTFSARVDLAAGKQPSSASYMDITGDGLPDIITANLAANSVSVLVNISQ